VEVEVERPAVLDVDATPLAAIALRYICISANRARSRTITARVGARRSKCGLSSCCSTVGPGPSGGGSESSFGMKRSSDCLEARLIVGTEQRRRW
jgi:hypothetical protein